MAILRASEGIRINSAHNTNSNWGCRTFHCYRTITADGINFLQFTQSGTPSYRIIVSTVVRWASMRDSAPRTEMPMLFALGTMYLNRNGTISNYGLTWINWGGNGINWPYQSQGGSSVFIGTNKPGGTNSFSGVVVTVYTLGWNFLTVTPFND